MSNQYSKSGRTEMGKGKKIAIGGGIGVGAFFAIMLVVGTMYSTSSTSVAAEEFSAYRNDDYGISLEYPKGWTHFTETGGEGMFAVAFVSRTDRLIGEENGYLQVVTVPRLDDTLEDHFERTSGIIEELKMTLKSYEKTTLAGKPAYRIDLIEDGASVIMISTVNDRYGFNLKYSAKEPFYSDHLSDAQHFFDSFKFIDATALDVSTERVFTGSLAQLLPVRDDIGTEYRIQSLSYDKTQDLNGLSEIIESGELGDLSGFQETVYRAYSEGDWLWVHIVRFDSPEDTKRAYNDLIQYYYEEGGYTELDVSEIGNGAECYGKSYFSTNVYCVKSNIYVHTWAGSMYDDQTAIDFTKITVSKIS